MIDTLENQVQTDVKPEIEKIIHIYKRTRNIYLRTRSVLGQIPLLTYSVSCTQGGKVNYGTNTSTKIYTGK